MAGKRIAKKRLKKSLGYKDKQPIKHSELKTAETKQKQKNKRANQQTARYNKNKEYLRKNGIPVDIITRSTSTKETMRRATEYQRKQDAERRKANRQKLYDQKINQLMDSGFSAYDAKKIVGSPSHQKNWKQINASIGNNAKTANKYLYVGFSDTNGSGLYIMRNTPDESRAQIDQLLRDVENGESGYELFRGIFKMEYGTEADMEHMSYVYYQRSVAYGLKHGKFDGKQYHKVTVSNEWTEADFLNLVNTVLSQSPPDEVKPLYQKFLAYDRENGLNYL